MQHPHFFQLTHAGFQQLSRDTQYTVLAIATKDMLMWGERQMQNSQGQETSCYVREPGLLIGLNIQEFLKLEPEQRLNAIFEFMLFLGGYIEHHVPLQDLGLGDTQTQLTTIMHLPFEVFKNLPPEQQSMLLFNSMTYIVNMLEKNAQRIYHLEQKRKNELAKQT
jgi:hypothetical protein